MNECVLERGREREREREIVVGGLYCTDPSIFLFFTTYAMHKNMNVPRGYV
jgi:hypothetical protein